MRKEESGDTDDKLVVMFPASKNYPVDIDDPLQELLNEFAAYENAEDLNSSELEVMEATPVETATVEAPLANSLSDKLALLKSKVELLKDTHKRSRYYLKELEGYLPSNRNQEK